MSTEACESGLIGHGANVLSGQLDRRFESFRLRLACEFSRFDGIAFGIQIKDLNQTGRIPPPLSCPKKYKYKYA